MKLHAFNPALIVLFAAAAFLAGRSASAQDGGCIELKAVAETEQEYVDEQGRPAKRLAPAGKVLPGDEVVWTIIAKNVCDKPTDDVVIANPVPEHMTYVASSAIGVGAAITYSLDNEEFRQESALLASVPGGSARVVRPDEYRAIRWTYEAPFAPGATAFVRYRALVK